MPIGDRLPYIALRGCLIAAIFWSSAALSQTDDPESEAVDAQPEAEQTQPIAPPSSTLTPEQEPATTQRNGLCDSPESREEHDLCQQWRVAKATEKLVDLGGRHNEITSWQFWAIIVEAALLAVAIVVAGWAAYWARRAAIATAETVEITRKTAEHQLRAYVSIGKFLWKVNENEAAAELTGYGVRIQWENCGATPALRCRSWTSSVFLMNDLPKDFDYPDVGAEGIETEKSTIGPGQYIQMTIGVSLADAQAVMRQERSLFVWGWIEYDDIFENTPRRRTEVCVQVEVNADCRSCTPTVVGLFNGADDDCHHKPKT